MLDYDYTFKNVSTSPITFFFNYRFRVQYYRLGLSLKNITLYCVLIACTSDLRAIKNIYWELTEVMQVDEEISLFKKIKLGVRQGCVLSQTFSFFAEKLLCKTLKDTQELK